MIENEYVKKAEKELETLSGDAYERRLAYLREKAIRDEAAAIDGALTRGREEGEKNKTVQIAKRMLKMKINVEIISEVTGLTKEEIEKL